MLGKILGLSKNSDQGTIIGKDGNRYTFIKEDFSNQTIPNKDVCVEFSPNNNKATSIEVCEACCKENSNIIFGITTIFITLIFGFIGTFISRLLFAKLPMKNVLVATVLHFIVSTVLIVPILGFIVYIIGVLYFTVRKYKLVMKQ